MANKTISSLPAASAVGATDLFVLQQANQAKKLSGQVLETWLLSMADGHGGIVSIEYTSSSGTNPVIDTYTITYADASTSTFTVTNGIKGDKGNTGDPARVVDVYFSYAESASGTTIPTTGWSDVIPNVQPGHYLWVRNSTEYNNGDVFNTYTVGYHGLNGSGSGDMTKAAYDPNNAVYSAGGIARYVSSHTPSASSSSPAMDGKASAGSSSAYARGDHVHPKDTSKANSDLSNVSDGAIAGSKIANGGITASKIADGAVSTLYTTTILSNASSWTLISGVYVSQITVNGLLATDNPIVEFTVNPSQAGSAPQQLEAWLRCLFATAEDGVLDVVFPEIPSIDIPIKILCIRK